MEPRQRLGRQVRTKLGRQIRTMREARGWTQSELGRQCGVGKTQISKIENGDLSQPELRLLKIAQIFGMELRFVDSPQKLWIHAEREEAYKTTVCELLRTRSVQQIDLLQFSGFTTIPVLETVADYSPDAHVRLLIASPHVTALYGGHSSDGFHQRRINSTLDHSSIITNDVWRKNPNAKFTIDVWRYTVTPSIAGIVADDWLVSVGWYRIFPNPESPTNHGIVGHNLPAITAIEEQAQPFLSMVREQINEFVSNKNPSKSIWVDSVGL